MGFFEDYGVPGEVAEAYLRLAARRGYGPVDRAEAEGWLPDPQRAAEVLTAIADLDLADVDGHGRWIAVDLDEASERLEARQQKRRQEQLAAVRRDLERAVDESQGGRIQELRGMAEINQFLKIRLRETKRSLQSFDLPPYANRRDDPSRITPESLAADALEMQVLRNGGTIQAVYHPEGFIHDPLKRKEMNIFGGLGEQARVLPVQHKLMIFDRIEALLGLTSTYGGPPDAVRAIRTTHPILMELLNSTFSEAWRKAQPWFRWNDTLKGPPERQQRIELCYIVGMSTGEIQAELSINDAMMSRDRKAIRAKYNCEDDIQLGAALERVRMTQGADELGELLQSKLRDRRL